VTGFCGHLGDGLSWSALSAVPFQLEEYLSTKDSRRKLFVGKRGAFAISRLGVVGVRSVCPSVKVHRNFGNRQALSGGGPCSISRDQKSSPSSDLLPLTTNQPRPHVSLSRISIRRYKKPPPGPWSGQRQVKPRVTCADLHISDVITQLRQLGGEGAEGEHDSPSVESLGVRGVLRLHGATTLTRGRSEL